MFGLSAAPRELARSAHSGFGDALEKSATGPGGGVVFICPATKEKYGPTRDFETARWIGSLRSPLKAALGAGFATALPESCLSSPQRSR